MLTVWIKHPLAGFSHDLASMAVDNQKTEKWTLLKQSFQTTLASIESGIKIELHWNMKRNGAVNDAVSDVIIFGHPGLIFPIDGCYYWYNRLIGRCITSQCDLLSAPVIGGSRHFSLSLSLSGVVDSADWSGAVASDGMEGGGGGEETGQSADWIPASDLSPPPVQLRRKCCLNSLKMALKTHKKKLKAFLSAPSHVRNHLFNNK